jgi:Cu/Ag efflux pump CusA
MDASAGLTDLARELAEASLGSLVGFLTVFGIAARNGILMVSHFQYLDRHEGEIFGPAHLLRGAAERLAPIMMTACAAGLVLVPLAIAREASRAARSSTRWRSSSSAAS